MKFTPTKRRLPTSHIPILEPVWKIALPSYTIYSNSLPLPSLTFYGPPPRASRRSAIHLFLVNAALQNGIRWLSFFILDSINGSTGVCTWDSWYGLHGYHDWCKLPLDRAERMQIELWQFLLSEVHDPQCHH